MILRLLFPPKCVLCGGLLERQELDLCHTCRADAPIVEGRRQNHRFIEAWTALWYYEGHARESLLRYKFGRRRSYAPSYGRLLALRIQEELGSEFDAITWVPVSRKRRRHRGFDQVELLAKAVSRELGIPAVCLLKKTRHTPAQSSLSQSAERRANVLGAYEPVRPFPASGQRVLLLDDIITTGSTVQECAKTLLIGGAGSVCCAAVAVRKNNPKGW